MTGDAFILEFCKYSESVDRLAETLAEKRSQATNGTRMMDNIRTDKTNEVTRRIEEVAILSDRYNRALAKLFSMEVVVLNMINPIKDNVMVTVLMKRYVLGKTYEQISKELGYSRQQLFRINKKALDMLSEIEV